VRRSLTLLGIAVCGIALLAIAGCGAKSGLSADDATTSFQRTLGASPEQVDCMRSRFADGDVAAVMDPATTPSGDQKAKFLQAVRVCLPIDAFTSLLSRTLLNSVNGSTTAQSECVRVTVSSMSSSDQDLLYLYFSNPASVDPEAVVGPSSALTSTCHLSEADPNATVVGPTLPSSNATTGTGI
jgi:hypothetical protein